MPNQSDTPNAQQTKLLFDHLIGDGDERLAEINPPLLK
jgi:hypothetical protein